MNLMFLNNVHILSYLAMLFLGLLVGKFCAWCSERLIAKKPIFSKEFVDENKKGLRKNYIYMVSVAVIYLLILYRFGVQDTVAKNLELIKYLVITPMLVLAFYIDFEHRIIPNRLTLTLFETGLIFTFLFGISNINFVKDMLLGMVVGGGIFIGLTLLGGLLAGKEAMGLGDVKLMGALGLLVGVQNILNITLLAFLLASVYSIVVLIYRSIKKNTDEYIAFGPFLTLAAILCIFLPKGIVVTVFFGICRNISNLLLKS